MSILPYRGVATNRRLLRAGKSCWNAVAIAAGIEAGEVRLRNLVGPG